MNLTPEELVQLYEAVVKPFGHPDPIGYMTRAMLLSEGDPDYIDTDGKQGFLPVTALRASEMVGAESIQQLESNVSATLAMDRILFDRYGSINDMIIAFHFGDEAVSPELDREQLDFIEEINESRNIVQEMMYPRLATIDDVIDLLNSEAIGRTVSPKQLKFYKSLVNGFK